MSDSNTIDLNKNKGMRALMIISNQDSKNPNATKHAAAEMAIDKCSSHCLRVDKSSEYKECITRCSDDFKAAFFIVNRAVIERQALNEQVERERSKIDRSQSSRPTGRH